MHRNPLPLLGVLGGLGVALASCGDSGGTKTPEAPPPPFAQDTYGDCTWEQVVGAQATIWSYNCGPQAGNTRLVADEGLPGFAIKLMDGATVSQRPVIRLFKKDAAAPVESVLEAVRAASPGPHTATCTLAAKTIGTAAGSPIFEFKPDAAAAAEWDKYQSDGAGDVRPPCGALGPQFVGDNYFQVLAGDPTTVVFVDLGSELPVFDVTTLKPVKK